MLPPFVASGCGSPSGGYIARQAWGQLRVLAGRQRIEQLLRQPDLPKDQRRKLELVLLARRYAADHIGLRLTGAYTYYYDTGGRPVAYNLSAAPKDALRPKLWTFPIVGALPYVGFFDRAEGQRSEQQLRAAGYDTLLRPVPAYSSLGWFDDPLYSSMLAGDRWRLVEVVIHETTHTTVFLRNQVAFNESLAMFVGQQGTLDMMARLLGPRAPEVNEVREQLQRRRRFARLVGELYRRLDRLYRSAVQRQHKLRQREGLFAWAQQQYKQIFADPSTWGAFVREPLNNAVLLSYGRYHEGLLFHQRVYAALGSDLWQLVSLYRHAQDFDDPIDYVARRLGVAPPGGQRM